MHVHVHVLCFMYTLFCCCLLQSTTISQIDERLICPLFGYRCLDDYYDAASNWNKIHKIATPFLCLSATDDPFVPASCELRSGIP